MFIFWALLATAIFVGIGLIYYGKDVGFLLIIGAAVGCVLLGGCASASADAVAECSLPVTRTDAMGIKHTDCQLWTFGAGFGKRPLRALTFSGAR